MKYSWSLVYKVHYNLNNTLFIRSNVYNAGLDEKSMFPQIFVLATFRRIPKNWRKKNKKRRESSAAKEAQNS